jgi:hypothetical protein
MLATLDSFVAPSATRPLLVRDEEGTWRYSHGGIAAVGARDVTLGDTVAPLVVARPGSEPEAVLLPLSAIVADQRLNWALQKGTRLEGDRETLFKVPWSVWQEHAAEPVDAFLPEYDASGVDRCLAVAERRVRFAKQALEAAGRDRTWLVVLATHLGRSRRDVGETLGLSTGRVQQLNEGSPSAIAEEVEQFVRDAAAVVRLMGDRPRAREDLPLPRASGRDQLEEVVASMVVLGLLEEGPDGLTVTDDGRALTNAVTGGHAPRADRATGTSSERADNASR